ncbi:MAG: MFS transporter [Anaerolineales bacterium]|jgi:MFS family permease|nr:MFS transporter [Anaerolineales bacterium]
MNSELPRDLRHNVTVNLLDGAFFGFGQGFASFVTIIPLFVSSMTDSLLLIGLIPAIHNAGWQLPQLFIAGRIARQARIKPLLLGVTTFERLPYLGLALVAFLLPRLGAQAGLVAVFGLLIVQGLGAGFAANPWQNLIGKIVPGNRRGTFFGLQAGLSSMLGSLSAVAAGLILGGFSGYAGFVICFVLASLLMAVSWGFLAWTREPRTPSWMLEDASAQPELFTRLKQVLEKDRAFRWFLLARIGSMFATIGYAFYTVYAVQHHGVSKVEAGLMTGLLMGVQIVANISMGWLGDRLSHRLMMEVGLAAMGLSALLAWWAPAPAWFYLVFALAALGYVATWTVAMSMTLEFGSEEERPAYIGMANTLVAPANILAPFLGGWLANSFGYAAAFAASAAGALLAVSVLHFRVRAPRVP